MGRRRSETGTSTYNFETSTALNDHYTNMATHSPHQSQNQFQFDPSTPPPPPPKPAYSSGQATPQAGPPRPPPPPGQSTQDGQNRYSGAYQSGNGTIQPPEHGWLPEIVKDKTFVEKSCLNITTVLQDIGLLISKASYPTSRYSKLSSNLPLLLIPPYQPRQRPSKPDSRTILPSPIH